MSMWARGIFVVRKIEQRRAVDDADARRRDHAGERPLRSAQFRRLR